MKKRDLMLPVVVAMGAFLSTVAFHTPNASAATTVEAKMVLDKVDPYVPNTRFGGMAYNGDFYVFYSQDVQGYISDDGISWKNVEANFKSNDPNHYEGEVKKIIWDGKQFVMLRDYGIFTSRDGVNWDNKGYIGHPQPSKNYPDTNQQYDFQDIIFANGRYIIVANDTNTPDYSSGEPQMILNYQNSFFVSNDLKTFQKASTENMVTSVMGDRPMHALAWNGKNLFLAGGNATSSSTDGLHWKGINYKEGGFAELGLNIDWDGQRFWQALDNHVEYSYDGVNWKTALTTKEIQYDQQKKSYIYTSDVSPYLFNVGVNTSSDGKEYIAAGFVADWELAKPKISDLTFYHSVDGSNWQRVSIPNAFTNINNVFATPHGFILAGNKMWYVSNHGIQSPSSWAKSEIQRAVNYDLVPKRIQYFYQDSINRLEFCQAAVNLYEKLTGQEVKVTINNPFVDTINEDVIKAYQLGIVNGIGNGYFGPSDPVSRQDLAVMLYKTLKLAGVDVNTQGQAWTQNYQDSNTISGYAKDPMLFLNQNKILNGRSNTALSPMGHTTREEAIVLIDKAFQKFASSDKLHVDTGYDDTSWDTNSSTSSDPDANVSRGTIKDGKWYIQTITSNYSIDERYIINDPTLTGLCASSTIGTGELHLIPFKVLEQMGYKLQWDATTNTMDITTQAQDFANQSQTFVDTSKRLPQPQYHTATVTVLNNVKIRVDGQLKPFSSSAQICEYQGHLYMSNYELIHDVLGGVEYYDQSTNTMNISSPKLHAEWINMQNGQLTASFGRSAYTDAQVGDTFLLRNFSHTDMKYQFYDPSKGGQNPIDITGMSMDVGCGKFQLLSNGDVLITMTGTGAVELDMTTKDGSNQKVSFSLYVK